MKSLSYQALQHWIDNNWAELALRPNYYLIVSAAQGILAAEENYSQLLLKLDSLEISGPAFVVRSLATDRGVA